MPQVLVVVDAVDGSAPKPALELLALARRIGSPSAVVFGPFAERTVETLASHGAEHVYLVKDQRMLDHLVMPKVEALEQLTDASIVVSGGRGQVTASIVISGRRVLGYPGPGGYTVSLVTLVAVSVAAAVVAASVPLTPRKAGPCSPP